MSKLFMFFAASAAFFSTVFADPQYYNYSNGTGYNSYPMNQAAGRRIQTYIAPWEFNQPSPAPVGLITKFSIRISTGNPLVNMIYTNFRIIFIDSTLPGNTMEAGWYSHSNEDTVVWRAAFGPVNAPADSWLDITLDHPYYYNYTKGLVIAIEQQAVSGGSLNLFSLQHTTTPTYRRHYSAGGAPFTYQGRNMYVPNCGITVAPPTVEYPNYLYYKFHRGFSGNVMNCAVPHVGSYYAPLGSGTPLTAGGQWDSCISGTGFTTGGVTTGWNCNLGTSSWTISMWLTIPTTSSGSAYYLFGDGGAGSFRCFHNGVALPDNLVLRGPFTDVTVTGIGPSPTVVTFVYDSAMGQVRAYKNGVLATTVNQTLNIPAGTGFRVGGYGTSTSFVGKLDEFRLWRRALNPLEVNSMIYWNPICEPGGVNGNNETIPHKYLIEQNFPNPFNPMTTITYGLPKYGKTKLVVYDVLGRVVETLTDEFKSAGTYSVNFDGSGLSSGIYFYTLESESFKETKKMMLIK